MSYVQKNYFSGSIKVLGHIQNLAKLGFFFFNFWIFFCNSKIDIHINLYVYSSKIGVLLAKILSQPVYIYIFMHIPYAEYVTPF